MARTAAVPALLHAAVAVALAAGLSGCAAGVDSPDTAGAAASAPSAPSASASASASAPAEAPSATPAPAEPTTTPTPQVRTIAVAAAGGQVTGTSGREDVRLGERVVLRVTSDVAEQVHVHGYDLEQDVPAGGSVDIPLTASIPGVFEVELHESGKALFQLRVA